MGGIAKSLGELRLTKPPASGRPDAQTPGRRAVQPGPRALTPAQRQNILDATKRSLAERRSERLDVQTPERPVLDGAKRSHPDFTKRTVYLRDTTHRDAKRKYEDSGGREFSELVEELLLRYLGRSDG